jgi:hypothetical protein
MKAIMPADILSQAAAHPQRGKGKPCANVLSLPMGERERERERERKREREKTACP